MNAQAQNRGRPRSFDRETALAQVLALFWCQGYLGTSYSDLCGETGLSKPSLYAAFGNKEDTFLAALALYVTLNVQPGLVLLQNEPDPEKAIHAVLKATAQGLCAKDTPPGCMIAANIACANAPDVPKTVANALSAAARLTPGAILVRLTQAQAIGQLAPDTDINALANYFDMVISGLSGLARQGIPLITMLAIVDTAMQVWPSNPPDPKPH